MSSFDARVGGSLNHGNRPLTNDELFRLAPSIFASDKHQSRSERYTYIPTIEVVEGMREHGFMPVNAKQGRCRVEGKEDFTKHLVRFRRVDEEVNRERQLGGLYAEIALLNSHDGTSRYKVMSGLLRLACLNGMLMPERELTSVSVPHKGDITHQVIEGSYTVLNESRQALLTADHWAGIQLDTQEQMVMAEAAHVIRFGDAEGNVSTPIQPRQLLHVRRREDVGDSLWTINNRIQENVIRGGITAMGRDANNRPRQVTSREVRAIDADVKINRALWLLSERMAQLKAA